MDEQTIEQFDSDLKNNLYKLWNRMSSGSYFPPRFVGYADDCNIYVRSERAGQRVMESISRSQELKLKVNEAKSAVARPQERKFLGVSFTAGPDIKRTIAPKSLDHRCAPSPFPKRMEASGF